MSIILVLTILDGIRFNYQLIHHYKTDERRIYVRYKAYGVKQYIKISKNRKIKLQPLRLMILILLAGGYPVYVVVGLVHFYNAWTLYDDHIFI